MIKRSEIHKEIDSMLDLWGVGQELEQKWGSITFNFVIENGKIVLRAKERETVKEIK